MLNKFTVLPVYITFYNNILYISQIISLIDYNIMTIYMREGWRKSQKQPIGQKTQVKTKFFFTVVHCINTPKHILNESKMQCIRSIKSVFPKLALLLGVWQIIFFTNWKVRSKVEQRNSLFKIFFSSFKTQVISFFNLKYTIESGAHIFQFRCFRNLRDY